ncbi:MAG: hypothetical protein JO356_05775 [Acidobacteria bacterium]|nr:hypothetical protein [Acidobacteriota bacterium]
MSVIDFSAAALVPYRAALICYIAHWGRKVKDPGSSCSSSNAFLKIRAPGVVHLECFLAAHSAGRYFVRVHPGLTEDAPVGSCDRALDTSRLLLLYSCLAASF